MSNQTSVSKRARERRKAERREAKANDRRTAEEKERDRTASESELRGANHELARDPG